MREVIKTSTSGPGTKYKFICIKFCKTKIKKLNESMFCFSGTATVIAILKGERGGGGITQF